jgi:predicted lipid-binding transport protein (Tim44 family)
MDNGFQFFDLLIPAMIAAFILLRLRRVLGRRTGQDRPPPEPMKREADDAPDIVVPLPERAGRRKDDSDDTDEPDEPEVSGLTQLKIADPAFDQVAFLNGARGAFEIILNAFAAGDKRQLKSLLSDPVYRKFRDEIDRRGRQGERLETTLISIILADIVDVRMDGRAALVTVKLVSEQTNRLSSADEDEDENESLGAPPVESITDLWTFARDTGSGDPNWQLVETRSPD